MYINIENLHFLNGFLSGLSTIDGSIGEYTISANIIDFSQDEDMFLSIINFYNLSNYLSISKSIINFYDIQEILDENILKKHWVCMI